MNQQYRVFRTDFIDFTEELWIETVYGEIFGEDLRRNRIFLGDDDTRALPWKVAVHFDDVFSACNKGLSVFVDPLRLQKPFEPPERRVLTTDDLSDPCHLLHIHREPPLKGRGIQETPAGGA